MSDQPVKLTRKEEAFCRVLIADPTLSQSDAYRITFKPKRMKRDTIYVRASELMAKSKIKVRIDELKQAAAQKAQMSRERWLALVAKCCEFDPRKMFDAMGNPKEISDLDDTEAAAIEGFEFIEDFIGKKDEQRTAVGYTKKFKLNSRIRALELMGKAQKFYAERQEWTGADGGPIKVQVEFVEAPSSK